MGNHHRHGQRIGSAVTIGDQEADRIFPALLEGGRPGHFTVGGIQHRAGGQAGRAVNQFAGILHVGIAGPGGKHQRGVLAAGHRRQGVKCRGPVDVIDGYRYRLRRGKTVGIRHLGIQGIAAGLFKGGRPANHPGSGIDRRARRQIIDRIDQLAGVFAIGIAAGQLNCQQLVLIDGLCLHRRQGGRAVDMSNRDSGRLAVAQTGRIADRKADFILAGLLVGRGPGKAASGRIEECPGRQVLSTEHQFSSILHIRIAAADGKAQHLILRHRLGRYRIQYRRAVDMGDGNRNRDLIAIFPIGNAEGEAVFAGLIESWDPFKQAALGIQRRAFRKPGGGKNQPAGIFGIRVGRTQLKSKQAVFRTLLIVDRQQIRCAVHVGAGDLDLFAVAQSGRIRHGESDAGIQAGLLEARGPTEGAGGRIEARPFRKVVGGIS